MLLRIVPILAGLCCAVPLAVLGLADEAPVEKDPAVSRQAAEEFDRLLKEWRGVAVEMRKMQVEFLTAGETRQVSLRRRYAEQVERGDKLFDALLVQARRSVRNSSERLRPDLAMFLLDQIIVYSSDDNYEPAQELIDDLETGGYQDDSLAAITGYVALTLSNAERAKRFLQIAKDKKTLNETTEKALKEVGGLEGLDALGEHWRAEQEIRAAEAAADDLPQVMISTNRGDITLELFENEAPNTVANFISLVDAKYYDGSPFHRVLRSFVAQGGDPTGTGRGTPGYFIPCECYRDDYRRHFRGSLSMAHTGVKDTGGSQFFLTMRPTPGLDGRHTVFGRIIEGLEVLGKLQHIDPDAPTGAEPDKIISARVLRKRDHEYAPEKAP